MILSELLRKWFDLEERPCSSCETLKKQLEIVNYEKKELLNSILNIVKPQTEERTLIPIDPIKPKTVPWTIKRQQLEEADRARARKLREVEEENSKSVEQLEKELGISNG